MFEFALYEEKETEELIDWVASSEGPVYVQMNHRERDEISAVHVRRLSIREFIEDNTATHEIYLFDWERKTWVRVA